MAPTNNPDDMQNVVLSIIHKYFEEGLDKNLSIKKVDGVVVTLSDERVMDISNLLQVCATSQKDTWEDKIYNFLDSIIQSKAKGDAVYERTYEEIKSHLFPKMETEGILKTTLQDKPFDEIVICYEILKSTVTTIAIDYDDIIIKATYDMLKNWGITKEELIKVAINNLYEKFQPEIQAHQMKPNHDVKVKYAKSGIVMDKITEFVDVFSLSGDANSGAYIASYALIINNFTSLIGREGCIFAIPNRDLMLVYPINDVNLLQVVEIFCDKVFDFFANGPYPVSPFFFWYHNNEYTLLPYGFEGDVIDFHPPKEFVDMLFKLSDE